MVKKMEPMTAPHSPVQAGGGTRDKAGAAAGAMPMGTRALLFCTSLIWVALWFVFIVVACRAERFRNHELAIAVFGSTMLLTGAAGMLLAIKRRPKSGAAIGAVPPTGDGRRAIAFG